jgi:uncharacterized membrane protein
VAPAELLLVAVRWAHAMASVAWVGGNVFLLWALEPALQESDRANGLRQAVYRGFRELADASIVVFVVTGAILTFDRLSNSAATVTYLATLAAKVVLAVIMFALATRMRRVSPGLRVSLTRWQVGLGALVILLAALLKSLYENGLQT